MCSFFGNVKFEFPGRTSVFSKILNDETRHHAAGVLLFRKYSNGRFSSFMADSLASLLQKVQAGPVMAAQALLREANRLELKSAKALLTEMRAQESTQHKLQRIRNIIGKIMVSDDLEHFDKMKMFSPFDENTMAQIIVN